MRMFLYYSFHSVKNQIKKMLKTWVLIFVVVCFVLGLGIGIFASKMEDLEGENLPSLTEIEKENEKETVEFQIDISALAENDKMELILGGLAAIMLILSLLRADESGNSLFHPADVPILFSSPLKPQSVLFFRLGTQLCLSAFMSVYFAFTTFLSYSSRLSGRLLFMFVVTFLFITFMPMLLRVLFYLLCSNHPVMRKWYRKCIYALLLILLLCWAYYYKSGNYSVLEALTGFLNAPVTRYIPIWGWTKGIFLLMLEGNLSGSLILLAANILACAIAMFCIWNIKADFYEEAMMKSEETAERMRDAQAAGETGVLAKRKKDRSDKMLRDGMKHGSGANIFFFKTLYNRFRFSHFHIFTKTMETYAFFAIGTALICRLVVNVDDIMYVGLVLAGLAFYRAMGNPMVADVNSMYFRLLPESTWAKLFFSLAGGSLCCLLDLFLPMILAAVIIGTNPINALPWMFFVVSMDFFSTCVGTFIGVSTPQNAGKQLKSIVMIFFFYLGMLPDIIILIFGFFTQTQGAAALICVIVNLFFGFAFYAFTPFFIGPFGGK